MCMARVPLTEEAVRPVRLVLSIKKVGLTDEQFYRLCGDNPGLRIELTAQKELVIMSPGGLKTGWRNNIICHRLTEWALKDGTGIVFGPSAEFTLLNGAKRVPDAMWITKNKWN